MKNFLFECKKMLKKRTIWVAVLLSIVAVAGFYFFNYSVGERTHKYRMLDLETSQIDLPERIAKDQKELDEARKAGDSAKVLDLERSIPINENMLKQKKFEWDNIKADNWTAIHEDLYERLENNVRIAKSQNSAVHIFIDQPVSMFTVRATAEEKRILAETGIEPMVQVDNFFAYHPTLYDRFTGKAAEHWKDMENRYGRPGFYFLYQVIPSLIIPFIILIGCFVFGNNVSSEATKKRKSMNLYAVLPVERRKIFFAKYTSGLMFTGLFVLVIMIVPLVSSLFTHGLGSLKFPVLIYDGAGEGLLGMKSVIMNEWTDEFHFITLGKYLGIVMLLTAGLVFLMYSVYFLLSLIFKNPSVNAAILLIGTFFGMTVLPKSPYNPFTYVDIHRVVNGDFAVTYFNESIDVTHGLIVLVVLGLLLATLSYLRFRRYVVE